MRRTDLSQVEKTQIIAWRREENMAISTISERSGRSTSAVKKILSQSRKLPPGVLPITKRRSGATGRPRKTSKVIDNFLKLEVTNNPRLTATVLKKHHPQLLENVSVRTVQNRIKNKLGVPRRVAAQNPSLKASMVGQILAFDTKYQEWAPAQRNKAHTSKETTTESQLNDSTDQPVNTMPKGETNNNIEMEAGFQDQETFFKNSHLPSAMTKNLRLEERKPRLNRSPTSSSSTVTEFDVFGKSVAAQLNNIPIEDAMKLQLQIQQLISHHRLKLCKRNLPPQKKRATKTNLKNADCGAASSFDLECDIKSENEFSEEPWDDTDIRYPTKDDEESGGQGGPIHGHEIFFTEVEPKLEPEDDMDDL